MGDDGVPPSRAGLYGGERSSIGKIRREKKPPSTPYDRPPPHRRPNGGFFSRLVDPAKRLLSGGATRFLPSLFSPSPISEEIHSEAEAEAEAEHATEDHNENISVNLLAPGSSGGVGTSVAVENLKPDISFKGGKDIRKEHSNGGIPDIEQLIKGKAFSRKEIDHLMEILRSRAVNTEQDGKAPCLTEVEGAERAQTSKGKQKALDIENEEVDRFHLTSTPLQRPSLQGEVGASPVDIARAYMGSRTKEVGLTSTSITLKNEKWGLTSEFPSKPFMPSPLPKAPICWPGAVTQNQQGYSTPQNQKSTYGIHSFSRSPYSRTMYTKSKSKLNPLRGDSERLSNTLSNPRETSGFGKSISSAAQGSYRSGGPIRRPRNKFTSAEPSRESPVERSIHKSPFSKEANADNMVTYNLNQGSLNKNNFDSSSSKLKSSEVSISSVHPHSSKLARQILEHIDRPVTLKEKSQELRLAMSLKNSSATGVDNSNPGTAGTGVRNSVDLFSSRLHSQSNGGIYGVSREKPDNVTSQTGKDVASGSKMNLSKITAFSDSHDESSPDIQNLDSRTRSSKQAINNNLFKTNTMPSDESKGLNTSPRKPLLPSIAVGKAGVRNPFNSDTSAGFTFPATSSSNTFFDLPTPTVMPSSLTSSPPKPNVSSSGGKITIAPPVYSLPPTSTTPIPSDDVAAPKFKFGSEKARLSFALEGDEGTSSSDAPSISYKFGSEKSRLNFGSIGSDALCC